MDKNKLHISLGNDALKKLISRKWTISILLTILMIVAYFGFILTIAYNRELLSILIADYITLAIPVGIGLILFAWLITGGYTYWANNYYDKEVAEIKQQLTDKK